MNKFQNHHARMTLELQALIYATQSKNPNYFDENGITGEHFVAHSRVETRSVYDFLTAAIAGYGMMPTAQMVFDSFDKVNTLMYVRVVKRALDPEKLVLRRLKDELAAYLEFRDGKWSDGIDYLASMAKQADAGIDKLSNALREHRENTVAAYLEKYPASLSREEVGQLYDNAVLTELERWTDETGREFAKSVLRNIEARALGIVGPRLLEAGALGQKVTPDVAVTWFTDEQLRAELERRGA